MKTTIASSALLALLSVCHLAQAQDAPPVSGGQATMPTAAPLPSPPPPPPALDPIKRVGIGYKIGNGIGFLGADLIITALPNLSFDFQVATVGGFDSAIAFAPALQGHLRPRGNSPYVAVGLQHIRVTLDGAKANGTGYFANIGFEWKWSSGLGIQLGGGVQHLDELVVNGVDQSARLEGGTGPNLEFGLRYRFI